MNIELDQMTNAQTRLPANERVMNKTEDVAANIKQKQESEKDKLLQEALNDKQKLLQLLFKVKKTFDGFKKRHSMLAEKSDI